MKNLYSLVVVYSCFFLWNDPRMLTLCSNIEDIARDVGSVDIEEDVLDSMLWTLQLLFLLSLIIIAFVFIVTNNDA